MFMDVFCKRHIHNNFDNIYKNIDKKADPEC